MAKEQSINFEAQLFKAADKLRTDWGQEILQDDAKWKYGVPPAGNANFGWMQHMLYHLAPHGVMATVLANGSLSSNTSGEGEIRKSLIENNLIECIVALPKQLAKIGFSLDI
jgi:type I restriction enzyme M protein